VTLTPATDLPVALSLAELGLPARMTAALAAQGIEHPFPVQALCIPPAMEGRDVCGKAKTGSGKTLAFGVPLLLRVERGTPRKPRGLVLVPTRELALQVHDVLAPLAKTVDKRVVAVYGGAPMERQIAALRAGVDVVVATPGRLIDLGERGDLDVSQVSIVVLDEADRMADMGFMPQVEWVLRRLPEKRQTLLFSATLDGDVDHLRRQYLTDPVSLEVESEHETVDEMEHRFIGVHQLDKVKVLEAITRGVERTLVFVRTKRGADRLVLQLAREGVKAEAIHGDLRQAQRERALKHFSEGKLSVLVATDVAARGIHVEGIAHVVNYDVPRVPEDFIHRVGRTGRAGARGTASTFCTSAERSEIHKIERMLKLKLTRRPVPASVQREVKIKETAPVIVMPVAKRHAFGSKSNTGFKFKTKRRFATA
jgi:superfamily II DNA/RNA helicase